MNWGVIGEVCGAVCHGMGTSEALSAATARLVLEGPLTLARATEVWAAMRATLQQPCPSVDFDLSNVSELDSAGVQLLLLARSTATDGGKELKLTGQSLVVLQTLELLRLDTHFGAPEVLLFDEDSP